MRTGALAGLRIACTGAPASKTPSSKRWRRATAPLPGEGQGQVLRHRAGELAEGKVGTQSGVGHAKGDRCALALLERDAAHEALRVRVRGADLGGGDQPVWRGEAERILGPRQV